MNETQKMQLLQQTIRKIDATVMRLDSAHEPYIGNALLNLALGHLIETHGQKTTAGMLARVVDTLAVEQMAGRAEGALDAGRLDS